MSARTVLAVRADSAGDVLLAGPAVRALAAGAERVVLLASPRGAPAGRLLPGVAGVVEARLPWIDPEPPPASPGLLRGLVAALARVGADAAVVFSSFHQSPLPAALCLRLARVPWVAATSEDYPGSLLDVRHRLPAELDLPEPERMLALARAAGFALPDGDDGRLAVRGPLPDTGALTAGPGYVAVHPGASVPARAWPAERARETVAALAAAGRRVVVTGGPAERELTRYVAGDAGLDLGGRTDLATLAGVLAGAAALVVANTGPAHLAAAVGTPVVSLFAPTVPAARWRPYRVPHVLLGDQAAGCAGTRATACPVEGHPCLSSVGPEQVLAAVDRLANAVVAA